MTRASLAGDVGFTRECFDTTRVWRVNHMRVLREYGGGYTRVYCVCACGVRSIHVHACANDDCMFTYLSTCFDMAACR